MWWVPYGLALFLPGCLCDINELFGGYSYPHPLPPVIFDDPIPSTPSPVYLPPGLQDDPPLPPPVPTYLPPVPTYIPPSAPVYPPLVQPPGVLGDADSIVITTPPSAVYGAPITPQMRIVNMSCVMDSFFRSMLQFDGRQTGVDPVVDDVAGEGCITRVAPNLFRIEMEGRGRMAQCGARRCQQGAGRTNMCVVVRVPTVRGLRLPEDPVVTLQCIPQETVKSQVKHIKLGSNTVSASRARSNNNAIATGGSQMGFDTRVLLLRRTPGTSVFDQPLQAGSTVQLGEELVMRAVVNSADGWKYSRVGPVVVRSASVQRTALLLEENGCRSASMRAVCPQPPRQQHPLDTQLRFRAFLFQGAPAGDDMVMSVRVLGCLRREDCLTVRDYARALAGRNGFCEDSSQNIPRSRREVRNITNGTSFGKEAFWDSQFSFRVSVPEEENKKFNTFVSNEWTSQEYLIITTLLGICFILIIIIVCLGVRLKFK